MALGGGILKVQKSSKIRRMRELKTCRVFGQVTDLVFFFNLGGGFTYFLFFPRTLGK